MNKHIYIAQNVIAYIQTNFNDFQGEKKSKEIQKYTSKFKFVDLNTADIETINAMYFCLDTIRRLTKRKEMQDEVIKALEVFMEEETSIASLCLRVAQITSDTRYGSFSESSKQNFTKKVLNAITTAESDYRG